LKNEYNLGWDNFISSRLIPDDSIYVVKSNTFYVIEVKHQEVSGSVDEKLQTCDFKKKQWKKIVGQLNWNVEYIYLLSEWFKDKKYKDVLDYIHLVGCNYYFEYIDLKKLGLPIPKK
jgi:hypothetical protein